METEIKTFQDMFSAMLTGLTPKEVRNVYLNLKSQDSISIALLNAQMSKYQERKKNDAEN